MPVNETFDGVTMARIAGSRAGIYSLLAGVFSLLPDAGLVAGIRSAAFGEFLEICRRMNDDKIRGGVACLESYRSSIKSRPDDEVLNEIAVDRTRITRACGNKDLKPPYEGFYKDEKSSGSCVISVKRFYRSAGLLPDSAVNESPDYLGLELDFMNKLCRRERDQWSSGGSAADTVLIEVKFLTNHLGSWVGEFCRQAEKHAATGFYRGFVMILDALVANDTMYLQELAAKMK